MNNNPNNLTLLKTLNSYLVHIQIDSKGNITSKVNAVIACRDYVESNGNITDNWVKSNWIVLLPAIEYYRKSLKEQIDDAKITGDEESFSELRTDYRNLQPYVNLLKPFRTFIR